MKRKEGYYWARMPSKGGEWMVGKYAKVNEWNKPVRYAFICREIFNEGRGEIDENVISKLEIEVNETRIISPDELADKQD